MPTEEKTIDVADGTPAADRVPLKMKIGYGAGGISDYLTYTVPQNMATPIYTREFGMDPALLGMAMAIPRAIAALSDAAMGSLSDNARTRWGRRKPFILAGMILCAFLLPALWAPALLNGLLGPKWGMFAYIGGLTSLYTVCYSVFYVPYLALGYELTTDYHERTRIQAWKGYLSGIAFFLPNFFYLFCHQFSGMTTGVRWLSVLAGAVMVAGALMTVGICQEKARGSAQARMPLREALALTVRNRAFLMLQAAVFFLMVGVCCGGSAGFFLLLDYVCGGDQTRYGLLVAVSGSVQNVMTYAGVALGVFCSVRLGKKTTAAAGCVSILTGVAAMSVFLAPCQPWLTQLPLRFHPYLSMIPGILMNLGLQGCTLMFASMTADICDEDERVTGLRREGAYAAMAGFLSKLAGVLMMGMSGLIPWLVGYHKAACAPTEAQLINMKWILIAAQGGIVLVALLFILLYPLTRDRALETRRVLDARKRAC